VSEGERGHEEPTRERPSAPPQPYRSGLRLWLYDYFLGDEPLFVTLLVPLCFVSIALFTRNPLHTNFIFDEQEALLANPYVRSVIDPLSKLHWIDAFHRDFWGLPADRSIGSYRPVPDLVWRALWLFGARDQSPFLDHWVNVLVHGVNGALLALIALRVTRQRGTAWLTGLLFVSAAVLTEAVSGVVGIADVLGATGALLGVMSIGLPLGVMPFAVFAATLFGLFSKESALVAVPLIPAAALFTAHIVHPRRPLRWARAGVAALGTGSAFALYVESRKRLFPAPMAPELNERILATERPLTRIFHTLLRWYAQPLLPHDPLNNPLIEASPAYRVAGALRVYVRGLLQVIVPRHLSGDYSAPQEPIPSQLVFPESILGALFIVVPVVLSIVLAVLGARAWRERHPEDATSVVSAPWLEDEPVDLRPVIGICLLWVVVSYFPVSNVPVLLPTVRAERFWYFPVLATSLLLGMGFHALFSRARRGPPYALRAAIALLLLFFGAQALAARLHANDYHDDLAFWDATRKACPRSAKAHLNYSVMQGARGNLDIRLEANRVALGLAPDWPMANIYLGDTLCRMHRPLEAWPYYAHGFELAANDSNLIALGVQCLWDEKALGEDAPLRAKLQELGEQHFGSWLAYIASDIIVNGETYRGVDPKYRPRGYNEGPKSE
jgi:hypothetical protein